MRHEDWAERLADYIESKRHEPFKWGANDCALFAKGAVESILTEPLGIKTNYRSKSGAMRFLIDNEADNLWEFLDNHFQRISVTMVQRGDLVGHMTTDHSVGVCLGSVYATPSDNGLVFADMSEVLAAWRVR